jgi:hypothetical protein
MAGRIMENALSEVEGLSSTADLSVANMLPRVRKIHVANSQNSA